VKNIEVITTVEGKIPVDKSEEFEEAYAALKTWPFPVGWVCSALLRNINDPEIYRIQTVWESRAVLEKFRNSGETPAAPALFKKFGAEPVLEIYDTTQKIP